MSAREVVSAMKGRWYGNYGAVCCPAHDDCQPSLLVSNGDDGLFVNCQAGCDWRTVKDELRRLGMLSEWTGKAQDAPETNGAERRAIREKQERDQASKMALARSIWESAESAQETPVCTYLERRGISQCPSALRYHKALKHGSTGLIFGTMVAAVTVWPSRKITGIHRTFLLPGGRGKANVSQAKMALGCLAGGAVRLAAHGAALGLAEGIETALSVQQATGTPMWACLSTSGLKGVIVSDEVSEILVFADADDPGEKAACEAVRRFMNMGKAAKIIRPPAGKDFNDVIIEKANG
jgi:putative DNA primase/helicase